MYLNSIDNCHELNVINQLIQIASITMIHQINDAYHQQDKTCMRYVIKLQGPGSTFELRNGNSKSDKARNGNSTFKPT